MTGGGAGAASPEPAAIQVWSRDLALDDAALAAAWGTLSPDEMARADRFHFAADRRDFVSARGWLRARLADAIGARPGGIAFRYGPHGKPALAEPNPHDLRFNLAHSHGRALLGLARGLEIGIDLEAVRPVRENVARSFFAAREIEALEALPPDGQEIAFFRCWTRKEAYLKALGSGLATPLDGFEVSLRPDEPARLLRVAGDPEEAPRWQMAHLDLGDGHVGALAARRLGWSVRWMGEG